VRISRVLVTATLAGVLVFPAGPKAQAQDPATQDLLSQLLSGLVLGTPYGAPGNLSSGGYGLSPYDPYGTAPYDPSQNSGYGSYGTPPPYGPLGLGRGYGGPLPGSYESFPYDAYRERGQRYRSERRLQYDYAKAMRRLERQEAEARAKAYRKADNPAEYRDRLAKLERKYAHKRYKVERNTARRYGYR
jgi:hypothetical protein